MDTAEVSFSPFCTAATQSSLSIVTSKKDNKSEMNTTKFYFQLATNFSL